MVSESGAGDVLIGAPTEAVYRGCDSLNIIPPLKKHILFEKFIDDKDRTSVVSCGGSVRLSARTTYTGVCLRRYSAMPV